ncbi:trichohyalin [Cyprinodon tularosa]|uniref:trichohyalin n=1 Tax=Cyprinodon tularosa TaxID=77115 RepID=UPI0018E24D09|nr:trichohyalin [Cyprinodon tularosa]
MSESVPAAQWEDKAMTLRSRRSERSRPGLPMTPPAPADPPPRYLRVGALQRWTDTGLDQRGGPDRGMLEESESEGRVALERDQDEVAAAPKRLKMLQAEEQQKPRATYFALTGQMQEISPGGATTVEGAQLYNEPSVRSSLSSFPARRNPSLELAFEQEKFGELMLRSHVQSVDVRSPTDKAAKEETAKKQEHEKETERHRAKVNQQAQADFERMRELDRQREYERQRQKAFEKEKRELEEEQQRQKQLELEKQKLQELERQRERREVERQKEMEAEKSRQMALEQEMLRMKELEKRTKLKEMELEKQRQREKERMQEMERLQLENERLRREQEQDRRRKEEQERKRKEEQERLREMERQQIIELEKQRSKERAEKEAEKLRQMVLEQEMLKMKELEKERAKEREMEMERQMEIRMEKERELEKQRQRQLDLERQQLEKERLRREQEQDRKRKEEQDRKRKEEKQEKLKEMERQQIVELEKQRLREKEEKEAEKLRQMALEQEMLKIKELEKERAKQREMEMREQEKRRQREMERQRQLDLERQQFENERLRKEQERDRQRKEQERLREMELEKRKAKEKLEKAEAEKMRHIAKQQEAERQRLKEKQKKEEEERLRLESSHQRHRGDPASSQSGDPSPRWREPHKPAGLNIDSFTSPTPPGFPAPDAWLQPTPGRDGSWKVPPQTSSPVWTTSPQDPWELRPVEMSVDGPRNAPNTLSPEQPQRHRPAFLDQPLLLAPPSGKEPQSYQEPPHGGDQAWIPREPHPPKDRSRRRTQGSQELSRMRSRSMCRRSAPASSTAEGSLVRMRSRSAHREQDLPGLVQQKQSGESDRRDSGTPVRDADSQYGTWDTGLRTDDSLTPASHSSESTRSASPRKHTPLPSPGPQASAPDGHSSSSEVQPLDFPDAPMVLLDNSALRSRAQLGKKRAPRTRPSKAPPTQADEGKPEDWLYRDSTEAKAESRNDDSETEGPSKGADGATVLPQQPQRVALFPGMDASALKAQLKKRGDSDNQTDGPAPPPSHPARSPRSPFLPRAARVLPPAGGKENGEEDSPQWLKELKSKKRLSHYESES